VLGDLGSGERPLELVGGEHDAGHRRLLIWSVSAIKRGQSRLA
jgi:hypothetical protein